MKHILFSFVYTKWVRRNCVMDNTVVYSAREFLIIRAVGPKVSKMYC